MDIDVPLSSTTHTTRMPKKVEFSLECRVCGDNNAKMHYGTLCCGSCKIFFRRNARLNLKENQCVFGEQCEITVLNRQVCRFCRLKKCFSVGLQESLIRSSYSRPRAKSVKSKQLKQQTTSTDIANEKALALLPTRIHLPNLLQNDRSLLTVDQWSFLSNVVNTFDGRNAAHMIRNIANTNYSTHPMKMRIKMAATNLLEVFGITFRSMGPYLEINPDFSNLSLNDRTVLLERNYQNMNPYASTVIFRDAGVYSSDMFTLGFPSIYGPAITWKAWKTISKTDPDGTLLKLIAPVLMFSTNTAVIDTHTMNSTDDDVDKQHNRPLSSTINLLHIQNKYIEMMFKYMIYRFGYNEAALRFAPLIQTFLFLSSNQYTARQEIQSHTQMMDTIVSETERLLTIQDDITD